MAQSVYLITNRNSKLTYGVGTFMCQCRTRITLTESVNASDMQYFHKGMRQRKKVRIEN